MLIAISGSQGSGKTTILNELKKRSCYIADQNIARSVLTDWKLALEDVNKDRDLTVKFQEEVLKRKWNAEEDDILHNDVVFTERTYADVFVYTLITLGMHNKYSDWLSQYYVKCMNYQQAYEKVFYLRAGHFAIQHDGTRGSNIHYSRMVDVTLLDLTRQMTHAGKLSVVDTPCLEQRLAIITAQSHPKELI